MDDLNIYKRLDALEKEIVEMQDILYNQHQQLNKVAELCDILLKLYRNRTEDNNLATKGT